MKFVYFACLIHESLIINQGNVLSIQSTRLYNVQYIVNVKMNAVKQILYTEWMQNDAD